MASSRASDGALTTYTYDMENHLVAVDGENDGTLRYDVLGRLAKLVTTVDGTTTTTLFHYDGDALVGEYRSGAVYRRYVHGDQVDEPLIEYQGANLATRRYLHADHQGSIIAHSTTLGAVTQTNAYDPYGIPRPDDENVPGNQGNEGRFGYTGQAWIPELGLNYYKARVYSPKLGRFLQTDPIFYKDDMNLYAYVGSDPLNRVDPTGRAEEEVLKQKNEIENSQRRDSPPGDHGLDLNGELALDRNEEWSDAGEERNNATTERGKAKAEEKMEKANHRYLEALGQRPPPPVSNESTSNEVDPVEEPEIEYDIYDAAGNLLPPGSEGPFDGEIRVPKGAAPPK